MAFLGVNTVVSRSFRCADVLSFSCLVLLVRPGINATCDLSSVLNAVLVRYEFREI